MAVAARRRRRGTSSASSAAAAAAAASGRSRTRPPKRMIGGPGTLAAVHRSGSCRAGCKPVGFQPASGCRRHSSATGWQTTEQTTEWYTVQPSVAAANKQPITNKHAPLAGSPSQKTYSCRRAARDNDTCSRRQAAEGSAPELELPANCRARFRTANFAPSHRRGQRVVHSNKAIRR